MTYKSYNPDKPAREAVRNVDCEAVLAPPDEALSLGSDALCPFSGDVDTRIYDGRVHWTCPECGTEHDFEEVYPG